MTGTGDRMSMSLSMSMRNDTKMIESFMNRKIAQEQLEDPTLDVELRKEELRKQIRYGLPTTLTMTSAATSNTMKTMDASFLDGTSNREPPRCSFDWTFGVTLTKWATFIAVIDIVKGTFGLIFAAYLAASIFRLMTETPDFEDLKRRMAHTEFVYIFAYGATSWGVVLTVCGISFWNFFLIVFGKVLYDATNQRSVGKLRFWYVYTIFSVMLFICIYVRLVWAAWECQPLSLCQSPHNSWVWLVTAIIYLTSFFPTFYSLAIVHSMTKIIAITSALRYSSSSSPGQGQSQSQGQGQSSRSMSRFSTLKRGDSSNNKKRKKGGDISENAFKNCSFQCPIPAPPPPSQHWNQLSQNESPSYKQTQVILPLNYHSTLSSYHHKSSRSGGQSSANIINANANSSFNYNFNTWAGMSEKERERNRRSLSLSIQKQLEMEDEEHLAEALC